MSDSYTILFVYEIFVLLYQYWNIDLITLLKLESLLAYINRIIVRWVSTSVRWLGTRVRWLGTVLGDLALVSDDLAPVSGDLAPVLGDLAPVLGDLAPVLSEFKQLKKRIL